MCPPCQSAQGGFVGIRDWLPGHQTDEYPEPAVPAPASQVREYRELLRTLPPQLLVELHRRALLAVDPLTRLSILRSAQHLLPVGSRLTLDEVPELARLLVVGEAANPGVFLVGLDDVALERLSRLVLMLHQADAPEASALTQQPPPDSPNQ
jgi:hypothetical protein